MENKSIKIEQLESLRGIAAFIVLLHHFTLAFAPQRHGLIPGAIPGGNLMETPLFFLINGTASVTLFFVLSGFVLSYGYFMNPDKSIAGAVIRRWPRLFPIALASTIISYALLKLGLYCHAAAAEITTSDWMSKFGYATHIPTIKTRLETAITQGAFFTFFRSSSDSWLNTSLWTMHLELLGSFIVFGLAGIVRHCKMSEALAIFAATGTLAFFGDVYLPLFVAGTFLAYMHSKYRPAQGSIGKSLTFLIVLLALLAFGYMDQGKGIYGVFAKLGGKEVYFRVFIHGIASLALIHLALVDKNLHNILSLRPLCFLGHISFPLYALHVPVILSLSAGVFLAVHQWQGYHIAVLASLIATLLVLLPTSYVFSNLDQRWCAFLKGKKS